MNPAELARRAGPLASGPAPAPFTAPAITQPRGGGAIRGIGEKFSANPVTGTGSLTVPIALSPGRSSFGPQLSLAYDSGAGNGPFGLGWSLSLPAITRKTDASEPRRYLKRSFSTARARIQPRDDPVMPQVLVRLLRDPAGRTLPPLENHLVKAGGRRVLR